MIFRKARDGRGAKWAPRLVGSSFADAGFCGASANSGLFRFHDAISGAIGQEFMDETFVRDGMQAHVFAYDWLGRQFAVSSNLSETGERSSQERTVVVFSPFDMSITPLMHVDQFMDTLGLEMMVDFLQVDLFRAWRQKHGIDSLDLSHCAGTTVPAYCNGSLQLSNLTYDDMDVYLTFCSQTWNQMKRHPPGSAPPKLVCK
ncbi:hypothetical protein EX895_001550 [Sporisorium graminicola]|uniref:Uncharacterized protein n=1 Tax=Sporisorium graminicola TaxID=280036 RepID=A0A4U7KY31_9BASI|nr:hypothetical protein EX895_001550 [Sporisorium graminicola]TKY89765.1 hypothetical protein EX895_001550 [Sporisorium graminicola]